MDLIAQASALVSRYLTGLSGVYAQLDSDHTLYVGGSDRVTAYGEVDPADPTSAIEVKRVWPAGDTNLSDIVPGGLVGFNMTFDGWIIIVTDLGWMVALSRDFQQVYTVQLNFAERDAQAHNDWVASRVPPLRGFNWVRNPMAIDQDGGIFVASNDHMHRVMWMGDAFSLREEDGAWTEPYSNSRGLGTGATPSLVGFGDEDQFVVITDGDAEMVYTVGARDGLWTLEGVDFCGGRSNFHYVVGGSRYNSLFSGVHLDQEGRIIYGNPFGKLRLDVN